MQLMGIPHGTTLNSAIVRKCLSTDGKRYIYYTQTYLAGRHLASISDSSKYLVVAANPSDDNATNPKAPTNGETNKPPTPVATPLARLDIFPFLAPRYGLPISPAVP